MNDTDDITNELEPLEVVALLCLQAQDRGYMSWVTRWAYDLYKDKALPIILILKMCGITNDVIRNLPEYKAMIVK